MSDGLGGIFGGGGGGGGAMGGLMNILDPLGLGPMIENLIGGLLKGPDVSSLASMGQSALKEAGGVSDSGQNQVGDFDPMKQGALEARGADPAASQATTEHSTSPDSTTASKGYAKQLVDAIEQQGLDTDAEVATSRSASTASPADPSQAMSRSASTASQQAPPPRSSSPAQDSHPAEPVKSERQNQLVDLRAINAHFFEVDGQGAQLKDGEFDQDNLRNILSDPYFNKYPDLQKAAQYLLDHPDFYNAIAIQSGLGDGCITASALSKYANALSSSGESSPGGVHTLGGQVTQGDSSPVPSTLQSSGADSSTPTGQASASSLAEPTPRTLDEMDARLNQLRDKMYSGTLTHDEQLKMTDLSQRITEMFTTLTNLQKAFHDMSMSAINNIR